MPKCIMCGEGITTPLCPGCVAEEMATWLAESQPEIVSEFDYEVEGFVRNLGPTTCIKCKEKMDTCSYCFIKHIATWLGDLNVDDNLVEEYNIFFNSPILDSYGVFEVRREV